MKIRTSSVVYVWYAKQYKKRKFIYEYQFVSYKNKMRFRGLSVDEQGQIHTVVFMFPGHYSNRAYEPLGRDNIKPSDLPPDIRNLKKRKDVVIPEEVRQAVERKSGCKLDTEFSKC